MDSGFPDTGLIITTILFLSCVSLWVLALIRIIKNDFPAENEKLIWALIVIFLPFLGTIIYFAIGKSREIKK
ncbi:MAG TPA: PLD nuclease N-terminal domain-containing protein [Chitinophagaceae bacterium]|nr:PLD nuclease N-terminal domain-containing protein [Chitinophagaceae bacterium]